MDRELAARVAARAPHLPQPGIEAVLRLFEDGATVPFIARYRKEATGGLDEVQIRDIERLGQQVAQLEARRTRVLAALEAGGHATPELRSAVQAAATLTALEDLYLPYKKKRSTRAEQARARGLEPLADRIAAQPRTGHPKVEARSFLGPEVPDEAAALAGAADLVAEKLADRAEVRARLRWLLAAEGRLSARLVKGAAEADKFASFDGSAELARKIPPHRYLALARGEAAKALRISVDVDLDHARKILRELGGHDRRSPFADCLDAAIEEALDRLLLPSLGRELRGEVEARAHKHAIGVFADNVRTLLLAPPLGPVPVLGVDPGLRTGSKCALIAASGALVRYDTVPITAGPKEVASQRLRRLLQAERPRLIAVGNGTGGRETEAFLRAFVRDESLDIPVISVSEAGASVYSASDLAREELPELDITVRGAVSIARRVQDPLAELVKIDPKAIGVGQYQHDLDPAGLAAALDAVVEDAVHAVGVDLATASSALLSRVAGLGPVLAKRIVAEREARGRLGRRHDLLDIKGLGKKTFEQCAGFLRLRDGHPLDATAIHPERYGLVERMAKDLGVALADLVGNEALAARIDLSRYESGELGLPTLSDIRAELCRPGRDPREVAAELPRFREDVSKIEDLEPGMVLPGIVTNVTSFGAFVDVGVHQDGLVHISELSNRFVEDPAQVVRVGQPIEVRVLSVDLPRRRISLSARPAGKAHR